MSNSHLNSSALKCCFCQNDNLKNPQINQLDLLICPECKSTFMPAKQLAGLQRQLYRSTRANWLKILKSQAETQINHSLQCIEHKEELVIGPVPDFGFEASIPTCCSLLHLQPQDMIKILEPGVSHQTEFTPSYRSTVKKPFFKWLGKPLYWFWAITQGGEDSEDNLEEGLEDLQWNLKMAPILE